MPSKRCYVLCFRPRVVRGARVTVRRAGRQGHGAAGRAGGHTGSPVTARAVRAEGGGPGEGLAGEDHNPFIHIPFIRFECVLTSHVDGTVPANKAGALAAPHPGIGHRGAPSQPSKLVQCIVRSVSVTRDTPHIHEHGFTLTGGRRTSRGGDLKRRRQTPANDGTKSHTHHRHACCRRQDADQALTRKEQAAAAVTAGSSLPPLILRPRSRLGATLTLAYSGRV